MKLVYVVFICLFYFISGDNQKTNTYYSNLTRITDMPGTVSWQSKYFPPNKFPVLQNYVKQHRNELKFRPSKFKIDLEQTLCLFQQCYITLNIFKNVNVVPLSQPVIIKNLEQLAALWLNKSNRYKLIWNPVNFPFLNKSLSTIHSNSETILCPMSRFLGGLKFSQLVYSSANELCATVDFFKFTGSSRTSNCQVDLSVFITDILLDLIRTPSAFAYSINHSEQKFLSFYPSTIVKINILVVQSLPSTRLVDSWLRIRILAQKFGKFDKIIVNQQFLTFKTFLESCSKIWDDGVSVKKNFVTSSKLLFMPRKRFVFKKCYKS